jgi:hypothetical protein
MAPDTQVGTEIVEFVTNRAKRARRGHPEIPKGTTLYAIRYNHPKGGYFSYSYIDRADAQHCINNGEKSKCDTEKYYEWNVVYDIQDTVHVFPIRRDSHAKMS